MEPIDRTELINRLTVACLDRTGAVLRFADNPELYADIISSYDEAIETYAAMLVEVMANG